MQFPQQAARKANVIRCENNRLSDLGLLCVEKGENENDNFEDMTDKFASVKE